MYEQATEACTILNQQKLVIPVSIQRNQFNLHDVCKSDLAREKVNEY